MTLRRLIRGLRLYAQGSLACLYLAAGGFLLRRNRPLLREVASRLGSGGLPAGRPRGLIPPRPLGEVIKTSTTVTLAELEDADGAVSLLELVVIASLVREQDPALSLEIGTFHGRTTLNIAMNQRPGTDVITLDLPAEDLPRVDKALEDSDKKYILKDSSGARFAGRRTEARIVQLYGDSSRYDFSQYAGRVDLVFVDGAHSYDFVLNDSRVALSCVRPGGVVLWHDYDTPHWPGVTRALNELYQTDPRFAEVMHIEGTSLCLLRR